jgi:myo-inositol catabolism protein IolS
MPYCIEHQISILAYSSLAQGLLTGKFGPDHRFPPADNRAKNKLFLGETYQRAQTALDQIRPIAERYQTSLGNLALAWLIRQPQTAAIVGARNPTQTRENAAAAAVPLSDADQAELDRISQTVTATLDDHPNLWAS